MTANKRSIKSDLRKVDRHRISPAEYNEAPELTDAQVSDAVVVRRGRPPLGDAAKVPVTLRVDRETVEAYRATGRGWQGRMNETLRRAAGRLKQKA